MSSPERQERHDGQHGLGQRNSEEYALFAETSPCRERVGERNLEQPIAEQVDERRRSGISGAVEGLFHDHSPGIENIPVADVAQRAHGDRNYLRILGKLAHDRLRESNKDDSDTAEKR